MSTFLNSHHELRAGWKFAAYIAFFLLIWVASAIALSMITAGSDSGLLENQLALFWLNELALFLPAVLAMWLTVRFIDHRPLRTFGIGFLPNWRRDLLVGLGLAAGMLALLIAGCKAAGSLSIRWTGQQFSLGTLLATFGFLLLASLTEELVFRGFPLQVLVEGVGEWPAMIGMSVLFGVMHMNNPGASVLGTINTVVAGILLSLAYVRTRSLWLPYAIHVGWNVGLGFVFGFPLSGVGIASLWTTGMAGSDTILGGNYGPEGGLLATFLFAASAVIVERMKNGHVDSTQTSGGRRTGRDHWN
jgi:membrane protease YdiL (CAAX protease family)